MNPESTFKAATVELDMEEVVALYPALAAPAVEDITAIMEGTIPEEDGIRSRDPDPIRAAIRALNTVKDPPIASVNVTKKKK